MVHEGLTEGLRETLDIVSRAHPRNHPTLEDIARLHDLHAEHEEHAGRAARAAAARERARRVRARQHALPRERSGELT